MKIGDTVNYFSKEAIILDLNQTHVLIQFKSGLKLCTSKLTFSKDG
jgi:hypothetical protein